MVLIRKPVLQQWDKRIKQVRNTGEGGYIYTVNYNLGLERNRKGAKPREISSVFSIIYESKLTVFGSLHNKLWKTW